MDVARILALAVLSLLVAAPVAGAAKRSVPHGFYGVMWDRGAHENTVRTDSTPDLLMSDH